MSGLNILALITEIEAEEQRKRQAVVNALMSPPTPSVARFANNFSAPSANAPSFLGSIPSSPPARPRFATSTPALPTVKRSVFYSFHYDDVIRVNNVRHTEQFKAKILEVPQSHYDRSLWENSKRTNPESLKSLIREGVKNTSVVCVLIGTQTWSRPWVRYEIARSVIDQKGLLAVDLNSINHHHDRCPHPLGPNPLSYMAVGKMRDGTYRLFEKNARVLNGQWQWSWDRYVDHMAEILLPKYLPVPAVGYVSPLDLGGYRYDACRNDVWKNMPAWLNLAATRAGRK
jgi:Thoeris protein ThsB, TIR-like domain